MISGLKVFKTLKITKINIFFLQIIILIINNNNTKKGKMNEKLDLEVASKYTVNSLMNVLVSYKLPLSKGL